MAAFAAFFIAWSPAQADDACSPLWGYPAFVREILELNAGTYLYEVPVDRQAAFLEEYNEQHGNVIQDIRFVRFFHKPGYELALLTFVNMEGCVTSVMEYPLDSIPHDGVRPVEEADQ